MLSSSRLLGAWTLSLFGVVACGSDSQVLGKRARGGEGGEGDVSGTGGAVGGSVQPQGGTQSGVGGSSGSDAGSSGEGGGGAVTTGGTSGRGGNAGTGDGGQSGEGGSGKSGAGGTSAGVGGATAGAGGANGGAGAGGASGAGGSGGATMTCGDQMCGAGQFCIAYRTLGGAVMPPDAGGNCPAGTHVENMYCLPNFSYTCGMQTSCTAGPINCACAASACPSTHPTCRAPIASSFLDPNARLLCELLGG